jgi:hypothetical protein
MLKSNRADLAEAQRLSEETLILQLLATGGKVNVEASS